ncbi:nitroreductase family protein [Acidisoma cladoniae]|jgi:nitroreductase|uniref:nitroreductase family protein n=1 Tax=Acidisoma cladoniae TaxID=3040935 RepID=UPI00254F1824|nr:nitroreductase family protein [Acidisoma sp. PAMC 29798]
MTMNVNGRTADHDIESIFLERWSPRAFTEEAIPQADLMSMIEAARWAPSSYNSQPWVFLYAIRGTEHWDKFLDLLNEFNQSWAKRAGALLVIASNPMMQPPGAKEAVPSHSHSFDAGAAWAAFALQGSKLGWHCHGMAGFDMPRAAAELGLPAGYRVEAAVAVGKLGDKSILPEFLQGREMPSPRKPVAEIAFEGGFPA